MANKVMLVAAEASSALFAKRLLQHWKEHRPDVEVYGVGSNAMEQMGFRRLGRSEEMAVVGVAEIVEHYSEIKKVFEALVSEAQREKPDVVVLMDYPEFNLKLAKVLSEMGCNVVYYITPQIWAWRKGRVKLIKQYCKKVFVIFPFEVKFFEEHRVPVQFVGHPLLEELSPQLMETEAVLLQRRRRGLQDSEIVLGLMPGSRKSELDNHLDLHIESARRLRQKIDNLKVAFLLAPSVSRESFEARLDKVDFPYVIWQEDSFEMISWTDLVVVTSGTATLQVALLEKPMVIVYKMKWLTYLIAKLIVHGVRFFGLPNLILNRPVVPELWQSKANPQAVSDYLFEVVRNESFRKNLVHDLSLIRQELGSKGATARVAEGLEEFLVARGGRK